MMNKKLSSSSILSWPFSIAVFAVGLVNTFWGNDPEFGILLLLLSFVYFPPVSNLIKSKIGSKILFLIKIVLAIFILWASLGVGELFDKIDLMLMDLKGF